MKIRMSGKHPLRRLHGLSIALAVIAGGSLLFPQAADAQRRGGGTRSGTMARSSISGTNRASQQATRTSSANRSSTGARRGEGNVDIDVDHDGWGGWHDVDVDVDGGRGDWDIDVDVDHYHPVATAAAIATTAAVVGAYYYSVPVGCPIVHTYVIPYYYCAGVYYQQQMQGDKVVYVVVRP